MGADPLNYMNMSASPKSGSCETYMLPYTHSIRLATSASSTQRGIWTSTRSKPTWKSRRMKTSDDLRVGKIHTNVDVFQYLAEFATQRPNCVIMSFKPEASMTYMRNQAVFDRIALALRTLIGAPPPSCPRGGPHQLCQGYRTTVTIDQKYRYTAQPVNQSHC